LKNYEEKVWLNI